MNRKAVLLTMLLSSLASTLILSRVPPSILFLRLPQTRTIYRIVRAVGSGNPHQRKVPQGGLRLAPSPLYHAGTIDKKYGRNWFLSSLPYMNSRVFLLASHILDKGILG